jgi:hypothetical protein
MKKFCNATIPKRLNKRVMAQRLSFDNYRTAPWVCFYLISACAVLFILYLDSNNVFRSIDRVSGICLVLFCAGLPFLIAGLGFAWPNSRLIIEHASRTVTLERRVWFYAYDRMTIARSDVEDIRPGQMMMQVATRDGIDSGSTALGMLSGLFLGVGWIKYRMNAHTVMVPGVLIVTRATGEIAACVCWDEAQIQEISDWCRRALKLDTTSIAKTAAPAAQGALGVARLG